MTDSGDLGLLLLSSVGTLGREIIPQYDFVKIYQSTVRPFKSLKLKYLFFLLLFITYLSVYLRYEYDNLNHVTLQVGCMKKD